jgi:glycosyltransferase involved in cell wall biosynthesis
MASPPPLVSVLIPMYNAGRGITSTLQSIRLQTFDDYEVIIVDDGSNDDSHERAGKTMAEAQVIRQDHAGLTVALNTGLGQCRGKYIARIDCFDLALPDRFAMQVDVLENCPEVGLLGGHVMLYDEKGDIGVSRYPTDSAEIERELIRGHSAVLHSTIMMRKSLLLRLGGYDIFYDGIEDFELLAKFSLMSKLANVDAVIMRILSAPTGLTYGGAHLQSLFDLALYERQQRLVNGPTWKAENMRSQYASGLRTNQSNPIKKRTLKSRYFAMRGGLLMRSGSRKAAIRDYLQSLQNEWTRLRSWIGLATALLFPHHFYSWALQSYKRWDYRRAVHRIQNLAPHD